MCCGVTAVCYCVSPEIFVFVLNYLSLLYFTQCLWNSAFVPNYLITYIISTSVLYTPNQNEARFLQN